MIYQCHKHFLVGTRKTGSDVGSQGAWGTGGAQISQGAGGAMSIRRSWGGATLLESGQGHSLPAGLCDSTNLGRFAAAEH